MTDETETNLINELERLSGSEVLHLFLDFHGTQLLTEDFARHCINEGKVDAQELGFIDDEDDNSE